jgi:hypothetical protein
LYIKAKDLFWSINNGTRSIRWISKILINNKIWWFNGEECTSAKIGCSRLKKRSNQHGNRECCWTWVDRRISWLGHVVLFVSKYTQLVGPNGPLIRRASALWCCLWRCNYRTAYVLAITNSMFSRKTYSLTPSYTDMY